MKQKSLLCGGTYTAAPRLSELCSALPSGGRALQARGSPSPTPWGQLGEAREGQYWSARHSLLREGQYWSACHSLLRAAFPAVVPVGWLYLPQFPK